MFFIANFTITIGMLFILLLVGYYSVKSIRDIVVGFKTLKRIKQIGNERVKIVESNLSDKEKFLGLHKLEKELKELGVSRKLNK